MSLIWNSHSGGNLLVEIKQSNFNKEADRNSRILTGHDQKFLFMEGIIKIF